MLKREVNTLRDMQLVLAVLNDLTLKEEDVKHIEWQRQKQDMSDELDEQLPNCCPVPYRSKARMG